MLKLTAQSVAAKDFYCRYTRLPQCLASTDALNIIRLQYVESESPPGISAVGARDSDLHVFAITSSFNCSEGWF